MPLKLVPPAEGRSPNWRIRGTYLGVYVDRSAGSGERRVAAQFLASLKARIERGELQRRDAPPALTFAAAAVIYMKSGGERRFLEPLLVRIADKPLDEINQGLINSLAVEIYPDASPATRNRQVFTPIASVLRAGGVKLALNRPKGWRGRPRLFFFNEAQAFALFDAAAALNVRFGALLIFLTYCGPRLSEALRVTWDDVDLEGATARLGRTKNGEPQTAYLPAPTIDALRALPRLSERGKALKTVFGFSKAGRLYELLDKACDAAGVVIPDRVAFHAFRHTYGAWMRRFGGLDTSGLVAAGRWADPASARVYEHVDVTDAARRADRLPKPPIRAKSAQQRKAKNNVA